MLHVAPREEKKDVKEIPVPLGGEKTKKLMKLEESTQRERRPAVLRSDSRSEASRVPEESADEGGWEPPARAHPPAQFTQLPEGLQKAETRGRLLRGVEPPKDLQAADEEIPSVMMRPNDKGHREDGEKQYDRGSRVQLGSVYCTRGLREEVSLSSFLRGERQLRAARDPAVKPLSGEPLKLLGRKSSLCPVPTVLLGVAQTWVGDLTDRYRLWVQGFAPWISVSCSAKQR